MSRGFGLRRFLLAGMVCAAVSGFGAPAHADVRDVVHTETTGTVVRSTNGECVRTRWMGSDDICAPAPAHAPPAPPAPAPQVRYEQRKTVTMTREERTVYFGFNQASISPQMRQRLDTIAGAYKTDSTVKDARIVGYADRIGNPGYNEKLSKKRAENVRQYLVSHGLINTQIADTRWVGENDPVTQCSDKLKRPELISCLQKDRRVEVEIDLASEQQASRE